MALHWAQVVDIADDQIVGPESELEPCDRPRLLARLEGLRIDGGEERDESLAKLVQGRMLPRNADAVRHDDI
jgi:hypothetical protein